MLFSQFVWAESLPIYESIVCHPFNQELRTGALSQAKFSYYIEQDSLYLHDFARCHALLASRVPLEHMLSFLKFAEMSFLAEQELVHQFYRDIFGFKETGKLAPATLGYTSYLLRTCAISPYEIAVAAVLPCFWVYREVGVSIAEQTEAGNPYGRWIETYSSPEFSQSVEEAVEIFDILAANATAAMREKMLQAFQRSCVWEWHFWNDAYHERVFGDLSLLSPAA